MNTRDLLACRGLGSDDVTVEVLPDASVGEWDRTSDLGMPAMSGPTTVTGAKANFEQWAGEVGNA